MATPTRAMDPEQAHVRSEGWGIYHQLIALVAGRKGTAADDLGPASAVSVAVHKPVKPNQAESKEWQGKSVSKQAVAAARQFGLASPARQAHPLRRAGSQAFYRSKHSLGCSYSLTVCLLVSGSILFNHLIFFYSQLAGADMVEGGHGAALDSRYWDPEAGLFKAVFYADIHFNTTSQDARELRAFAYDQLCQHTPFYPEIDCATAIDDSLCTVIKCQHWQMSKQAVQMSYMYSIWDLWQMETVEPLPGMPADSIGTANVTRRYGQAAAGVLFGFSFVWPHVKLLLLHLFFYLPLASRSRRNGNYWLAVFGKWSFTDVLVLSTLVGVFHLTVDTTAHQVWDRAAPDLIRTCETTCQEWIKTQTSGPDLDQMERAFESSFPPMAQFRRWEQGREDQMAETRRRWREYLSKRSEEMGQNLLFFHRQEEQAGEEPPPDGWVDFEHNMPQAYSRMQAFQHWEDQMRQQFSTSPADQAAMLACETGCHNLKLAVNESLNVSSPDFVSRLSAGVQMEGMQAMYTFCVAVMLSLILSLVVERLEGRGTPLVPTEGWEAYDSGDEASTDSSEDDAVLASSEKASVVGARSVRSRDLEAPAVTPRAEPPPTGRLQTWWAGRLPDPIAGGSAGAAASRARGADVSRSSSIRFADAAADAAAATVTPASLSLDERLGWREGVGVSSTGLRLRGRGMRTTTSARQGRHALKLKRQMTVLGGATPFLVSREWAFHLVACLCTSGLLYAGMVTPCFTRTVSGSMSQLLQTNGFDFDAAYSIYSLSEIIYGLGGLNRGLMYTTYLVFCIIGPVLRCVTQLLLLLLPLPTRTLRALHEFSRSASIFYALEVLLVAVPLLNITFGPVSKNLLTVYNTPVLCEPLMRRFGEETCLMISVDLADGYYVLAAHVALFLLTGFDGSATHKYCQHELHRSDCPPFSCCEKPQRKQRASAR